MPDSDVADATRRTRLANERTFLAWLRSGLTALAVALGAGRIVPGVAHVKSWPFELLGAGFAILGLLFLVYAARRYVHVEQAIDSGPFAPLETRAAIVLTSVSALR